MKSPLYIGIAAVIVVLAIYFLFFRSSSEGFSDEKKTLILFYLPGCGFCTDMMPEWKKLEAEHSGSSNVDIRKVNCGDNPEVAEEHGISGFPTIILFKEDGSKSIFDGERTKEAFNEFIRSN